MSGRPAPKKPRGRPPKYSPEVQAEALRLAAATSPEDAAETLATRGVRVTSRQIYNWINGVHTGGYQAKPASAPPAAAPSPTPPPATPAPPDPLVLVRRILQARDPSALAELEAGIAEAAKGEPALVTWLSRPLPENDTEVDPLDAAATALAVATRHLAIVPPMHPRAASLSTAVANLAARVEKINASRPREETPDEVTDRINARRDVAVAKILEHTAEARAKLAADRKSLAAWASEELPPRAAVELQRRIDDMLGGPLS